METIFSFNTNEMLPKISQCKQIVKSKNSYPILDNFKLDTYAKKDGSFGLIVTASDNDTWLSVVVSIFDCQKATSLCVNASDFLRIVSALKNKTVQFCIDEEKGQAVIKHEKGKMAIPYEATQSFPAPCEAGENKHSLTIDGDKLSKSIQHVLSCVANDELRPQMNGVKFDFFKDSFVTVASDGYALSKYTDKTTGVDEEFGFILPKNPSFVLANIVDGYIGSVQCEASDEGVAVFKCADFKLATRLIEGRYPNYNSVIPNYDDSCAIYVDTKALLIAIKRALLSANSTSGLIILAVQDSELIIHSEDIDFNKGGMETLDCTYKGNALAIGFKGSILLSVLQNIDTEETMLKLQDPTRAGVIAPTPQLTDAEVISIVMPMKID